jgi:lycopene cyclase domain-containing protein
MLAPYTYLMINFSAFIICFVFSFDKRIQFNKHFGAFIKACLIVPIPFLLWDAWFTDRGVWWFNYNYTLGLSIAGLPLEEIMFFIFIPFACVFTYYCLEKFFDLSWANVFNNIIVFASSVIAIVIAFLYYEKAYTQITALAVTLTLLYLHFIAKVNWIGQASFIYLILMLGFFPVNGLLTGTGLESPVVNYNTQEILNIRILTIPVEDFVYGYTLFLLNVYFFKKFQKPVYSTASVEITSQ